MKLHIDIATEDKEDEETGEYLCNCTLSLACSVKIILNAATLRLKRGHCYGLCGRTGSGVNQHPDFILCDKRILVDKKKVIETLASVGFDDEHQSHSIGSLSGGWKMRLALARAILFKADIILLNEPTNHLDFLSIVWLESYLMNLTHCISIIASHHHRCSAPQLLQDQEVPGNFEAFVKAVPEARFYYNIKATDNHKFIILDPSTFEGVKAKSLLKSRRFGIDHPTQLMLLCSYVTSDDDDNEDGIEGAYPDTGFLFEKSRTMLDYK